MKHESLFIHDVSRILIEAYLKHPTHALLISGPRGCGSSTIAYVLAKKIVENSNEIIMIKPDQKGTIGIESVRELYVLTRDKKTSAQVVLIDNIEYMSHDAQHAFLKLLEEPSDMTRFIMTSHKSAGLLPTIFSRLQHIVLRSISDQDSAKIAQNSAGSDAQKTKQLLFLASGLPAEMLRLAGDDAYFEARSARVTDARNFITGQLYDRLAIISHYSNRNEALDFVASLGQLVEFAIKNQSDERMHNAAKIVELVASSLRSNGHVKTHLMRLAMV